MPKPARLQRREATEPTTRELPMKKWSKPRIAEIRVGMEINAYACAER